MSDDLKLRNRLAQRRWRERLKADPEKYEEYKKQQRRRMRLYYQQNLEQADRKRAQHNARYASDPGFRARSAARGCTPENLQYRRALQCLKRGDLKHLPDQLRIVLRRAGKLMAEINET